MSLSDSELRALEAALRKLQVAATSRATTIERQVKIKRLERSSATMFGGPDLEAEVPTEPAPVPRMWQRISGAFVSLANSVFGRDTRS